MRTTMFDILAGAGAVLMAVALLAMVVDVSADEGPGDPLVALMALGMIGAVIGIVHRFEQGAAQQPTSQEALLQARRCRAESIDSDRPLAISGEPV